MCVCMCVCICVYLCVYVCWQCMNMCVYLCGPACVLCCWVLYARVCLFTPRCVCVSECVCMAPNPELLCGDSRYNICKPLLLCWISNGLKTSPLSVATLLQLGLVYSPPHTPSVIHRCGIVCVYVCVRVWFIPQHPPPSPLCICHTQKWS